MASMLDRKFAKLWQSLKNNAGVKSSPWFKKADAAVSKKVEAYQRRWRRRSRGWSRIC